MGTAAVIALEVRGDIAVVTVNNPPVNTITAAVRAGLRDALAVIEPSSAIRAVLLRCEGSTFCSGADIGEFDGPPKEAEYRELFGRIEALNIPVVVAMQGTALGGGLELALACHYRVAAASARFGLPEVTLGIIPGAGGTQRLPRLIGLEKALEFIISAKPVDAAQARQLGFIDEIITAELQAGALEFARALLATGHGARRTSERSVDPASAIPAVIERLRAQAQALYPNRTAALTAVQAVQAAVNLPFAQGLLYEDELANQTKHTAEARGAIHVFFAERAARRVVGAADGEAAAVRRAGIVGAGTMGGGIAMCFANAGIPVTLIDSSQDALERGLGVVTANYASMVKRGRLSEDERSQRLALIRGSLNYEDLQTADLIVEAVYENMALKQEIFRTLDRVAKAGSILASNTSTLDITELARATSRPSDVIGMHFFSPANVMPLLEVIRTSQTGARAIRTAMELARPLRKTPVLARVCYGFVGNRMMEGYAAQAERMVLEGATPRQIDSVLERFGMAMGILAVFDMAGIDVGVNVHKANADRYPSDPSYYQADFALVEAGRLGQKNGQGYYRYQPGDRTRHDDPEALAILQARAQALRVPSRSHSDEEILERCLFALLNEGFRILQEGVVQRASDIDVVWTSGYGFPRYRGGPMFYAEAMGLTALLTGIRRFGVEFGAEHWRPAPLLLELVASGRSIADWEGANREAQP
ncbi:MAG TPA: 3-hydroxyacyl-CoA dehydrogenase NAD-binding domain-containing protein [Steroidobacteraceae bacterium]